MGRKQQYITDSDKLQARRERQMRYYERNKEEIRKRNLKSYYTKKQRNLQNNT